VVATELSAGSGGGASTGKDKDDEWEDTVANHGDRAFAAFQHRVKVRTRYCWRLQMSPFFLLSRGCGERQPCPSQKHMLTPSLDQGPTCPVHR
jgi:hypothetical protein